MQVIDTININLIAPNKRNPRKTFSHDDLCALAETIKEEGLLQPIAVRKVYGSELPYELIFGERRLRACKIAGLKTIDVKIVNMTDEQVRKAMLIENLQRANIDPIEEAQYINDELVNGENIDAIALAIGKSKKWILNRIQLAKLPESIVTLFRDGALKIGHLFLLSQVHNKTAQFELSKNAAKNGMSVEQLKANISLLSNELSKAPWNGMDFEAEGIPFCEGCQNRTDIQTTFL